MSESTKRVVESSYMLGSSRQEQDRLFQCLQSFGQKRLFALVEPGMRVLDVGCGPGAVATQLAVRVGPTGSVTGVDLQEAQLERARAHVTELGLTNATFETSNAMDMHFESDKFDLVYAKLLTMHLPDPLRGLAEMCRVLRPGGTLFLHEVDSGGHIFYPEGTPTQTAWNLCMSVLSEGGSDPEMGRKLYGHLVRMGFEDIRVIPELSGACAAQPRIINGIKRQICQLLESMSERIVAAGYRTHAQIERLAERVLEVAPDEFFTSCGINCWGHKPRT